MVDVLWESDQVYNFAFTTLWYTEALSYYAMSSYIEEALTKLSKNYLVNIFMSLQSKIKSCISKMFEEFRNVNKQLTWPEDLMCI